MSFSYFTRPMNIPGRYTGQPKYRGLIRAEESMAELARRSGVPEEQVARVLRHLGEFVVDKTMDCWRLEPLADYFGFQASCGGSHESTGFAPTYDNLAVDVRMTLGETAIRRARERFKAEGMGHSGRLTPVVIRVTNMAHNQDNSYTPGACLRIELKKHRGTLDPANEAEGVFLQSSSGDIVRCSQYGYIRGRIVVCVVPDGLTGEQLLSVSMIMNDSLRTGVRDVPLQFMPLGQAPPSRPAPARRRARGAGRIARGG